MIDWDDVRYLLAVAREGSVRAAAERLEVNHSTVLRRVAQLEERLGAQMFEKLRSGYRPYRCGEEVLEFAEQMKASSNQLAARMFGLDQSVHGLLRVTVAPPSARSRSDETVGQQIKASFLASDRTYGARRVWRDLLADGVECGLHRIERLMRLQVLRARPRRLCFVLLCGEEAVQALGLKAAPFLSSGWKVLSRPRVSDGAKLLRGRSGID